MHLKYGYDYHLIFKHSSFQWSMIFNIEIHNYGKISSVSGEALYAEFGIE